MQGTYVHIHNRIYRESVSFFFFNLYHLTLTQYKNIRLRLNIIIFSNSFLDCLTGYFGYRCEKACSGHCMNNTVCDYIDGRCRDGCQPGYIGGLCNACKISKFHFYSVLDYSFVNDYVSYMFNCWGFLYVAACKKGYYGQNCSRVCSSNCKKCKPTDGTCSCYAGWMGPNCRTGICIILLSKLNN